MAAMVVGAIDQDARTPIEAACRHQSGADRSAQIILGLVGASYCLSWVWKRGPPVHAGGPLTKAEKRVLGEQSRPVPTSTNEASTAGHVSSAPAGIADHPQQARQITRPD
jgi:hypothetical protein